MHWYRALLFASLLFSLTACGEPPEAYPPPEQRKSLAASERDGLGHFVRMNVAGADLYIVRDVAPVVESGSWRWAFKRPELRFYLEETADLKFALDFAVPEVTFRHTGPVTLSLLLNDRPFRQIRCDQPGPRELVWPVPAGLLRTRAVNTVVLEPDKVWVSQEDGATLSFILTRAGFLQ